MGGWTATATVGAAVGVMSASALARRRARPEMSNQVEAGTSSSVVSTPVGKGGFVGATNGETIAVVSRCPKTGPGEGRDVVRQRVGLFAAGHRPDSHCCSKNASGSLGLQPAVLQKFSYIFGRLFDVDLVRLIDHKFKA